MIDAHVNNRKSPKFYVRQFLEERKSTIKGKRVVDIPAGNGATSEILMELGAQVSAFDLFPEYFMLKGVECNYADVMRSIPMESGKADLVICQEGIEHFSDQLKALKEFNRILKRQGKLLITTPSYSNLASKFSYLLFESESVRQMPPNEIDDVWMSDKKINSEMYYGHIFLVGLQRLRTLGRLAGFRIDEIRFVRLSKGSLLLLPFFYPFIFISSYLRYFRNIRKNENIPLIAKRRVYDEQLKINLAIRNLVNRHTFVCFEKQSELGDIDLGAEAVMKPFDKVM